MISLKRTLQYWYVLLIHGCAVLCSGRIKCGQGVLLLRLDALGDFILWLDSAKEYRKIYPERKITLMVNASWVELAKSLPYWDDVWPVDTWKFRRHPLYRIGMLIQLRRRGFGTLIQPRFSRELLLEDSIILSSQARERIGIEGDLSNIKSTHARQSLRWYTKIIPSKSGIVMELTRNAEFIRALGLSGFQSGIPRIDVQWTVPDNLLSQGKYFVVCPGTGTAGVIKQWPVDQFVQIIRRVYEKTGWKAVICGDESQGHFVQKLEKALGDLWINCIGKTSVEEYLAIIAKAKLLVGNDSSCIHIAAAFNVPSIGVTGGGHFGRFMPYQVESLRPGAVLPIAVYKRMDCFNCNWKCIYHVAQGFPAPCMVDIDIERVWTAVEAVIDERKLL